MTDPRSQIAGFFFSNIITAIVKDRLCVLDFIRDLTFFNGNLDSANKFNNTTSEQC